MNRPLDAEAGPLRLSPVLNERIWGGFRLGKMLGQTAYSDNPIGEAWIAWDDLVVENGKWRGNSLHSLISEFPTEILGANAAAGPSAGFPLLAKLLDAQEDLSVQVHPDDGYARAAEHQPFGKTEAWYILEAEPGARIAHGVKSALTKAEFKRVLESGTIADVLDWVTVSAGDVVLIPAGTIHVLGEGILVYELQESSDLTYRLFDWNRVQPDGKSRELHIDKALDVSRLEPVSMHKIQPVEVDGPSFKRKLLCACDYFALELLTTESQVTQKPLSSFHILTVLEGGATVSSPGRQWEPVALRMYESVLVPAAVVDYEIRAEQGRCSVMKAYVPDLRRDIVEPLKAAGVAPDVIVQLGGEPERSDLKGMV